MKRGVLSALALISILFVGCSKNELGKSADTVKKLATDFYFMTVTGDAGFDKFLEQGGASSAEEMSKFISGYLSAGPFGKLGVNVEPSGFACSALHVSHNTGGELAGRNYDWDNCKTMIIRNLPDNGYKSLSTVNLDFLGFGDSYEPTGLINAFKAVAGVYVPMDGINEKGLVVADLMAGDDEATNQNTDKPDLTTTSAIRLILNKAADVDEAIALLGEYDMHSDINTAHHLFLCDAAGKSVCIEWVSGEMIVSATEVLNNHYICQEKKGIGSGEESLKHEASLLESCRQLGGVMTEEQLADAMFKVLSLPDESYYGGTQWTIVYDTKQACATWYWRRDRAKSYKFFAGTDLQVISKDKS